MDKEDIQKKLRILGNSTARIKYLEKLASSRKFGMLKPETQKAVYENLGELYEQGMTQGIAIKPYRGALGGTFSTGNPELAETASKYYKLAGNEEAARDALIKGARKVSGERNFYFAGKLLEMAGEKEEALDEFGKYVSSPSFPAYSGGIDSKILEKLKKAGRTEALKKAYSNISSQEAEGAKRRAEDSLQNPEYRHSITDKKHFWDRDSTAIRSKYASAIKHARVAGQKDEAKRLSREYQAFKQQAKELEQEEARKPMNRLKGLVQKLVASVLIIFSAVFLLFSSKGLTGNTIINESVSSNLSILLAVLVFIGGLYIWIKK